MSRLVRIGMLVCVALAFWTGGLQAEVVISEIMYHPVEKASFAPDGKPLMDLTEDVFEFIELHNPDSAAVDLGGWRIDGGVRFTFPPGTVLAGGGYLVAAKRPAELRGVPAYRLGEGMVFGPWEGGLSNEGESIELKNAEGETVEELEYSSEFPWPITANALGAETEWTGLRELDYQYRGRSLERVSMAWPAQDPANWAASPIPGEPSPGAPNATASPSGVYRAAPKPVVVQLHLSRAADGQSIVRPGEFARLECLFSSGFGVSQVEVEYFVDSIDLTNEVRQAQAMLPVGLGRPGHFVADLPGQLARSVVRYRIWANRGEGREVASPRADDPYAWHGYFVTPQRGSVNPIYDLLISSNSLRNLTRNLADNPNSGYRPRTNVTANGRWNLTEPAIFAHDGRVYDVRTRYNGSFFRRSASRQSYKVEFPRHARFQDQETLLITDKDSVTVAAHRIFREAGLPTSTTRSVDLYVNRGSRLTRLQIEEHDDLLLEKYHRARAARRGETEPEAAGRIFKSSGILDNAIPYGRGDGSRLPPSGGFSELVRYEWVYSLKNDKWRGYLEFKEMLGGLAAARGSNASQNAPALRAYFEKNWDTNDVLTYLAVRNWMSTWDDTVHNFFLWQKSNGRWSMLPWDFDADMGGSGESGPSVNIFRGENNSGANTHGNHPLKDSLFKALRQEYKERLFWLNNTLLHPDNIRAMGITTGTIPGFSRSRHTNVNRQLNLGVFQRPARPTNLFPASGSFAAPLAVLRASAYGHTTNPAPRHVSTTWQIRAGAGSYAEPVFETTTAEHLTSFPLPGQLLRLGETYFWKCTYHDASGRPSVASAESSFRVGGAPVAGGVMLNEILADNTAFPNSRGRFPDWIELRNTGGAAADLGGWGLTDDLLRPNKFVFPVNTTAPAGGYLLVWCDDDSRSPGLHSGFGLKAEGEAVGLFAPSEDGWQLRDAIAFGPQAPNFSIGRDPTGLDWRLSQPTPAALNTGRGQASNRLLKINEWMARPASGADWVELFNPEPEPVALEGLALTDDPRLPRKSPFAPLSFLAGGGYLRVWASGEPDRGADHLDFKLARSSGFIGLYDAQGMVLDSILYRAQRTGIAEGRVPDGSLTVVSMAGPGSAGRSNEIDLDADGLPDSWEQAFGLDTGAVRDGEADADRDGISNAEELAAGSNPADPGSRFELGSDSLVIETSGAVTLRFVAAPGRTYTVQTRERLEGSAWQKLGDVGAYPGWREVTMADAAAIGAPQKYYRVITPAQP